MKTKKKAFILSLIPGCGHFYIGLRIRGIIYILGIIFLNFIMSIGIQGGGSFNAGFQNFDMNSIIRVFVWLSYFASIIDCIFCYDKIFMGKIDINDEKQQEVYNKKLIAMFLSIIPGCGHILLGKYSKGINFLLGFFMLYILSSVGGMSILKLLVVILIIICIYDIYNDNDIINSKEKNPYKEFQMNNKAIYIALGVLIILCTIFYCVTRVLSYLGFADIVSGINYVFSIGINSIVCIAVGVFLIKNGMSAASQKEKELDETIAKEREEEKSRKNNKDSLDI